MKIPAFVVIIGLIIVGFVVFRSVVSTLNFSAKLMTWGIFLALGIGAALYYSRDPENTNDISPFDEVQYRTQADDRQYQ